MEDELEFRIEATGERLDRFLAVNVPETSRARVQKLIEQGHVHVNRELSKPAYRLQAGDLVQVTFPKQSIQELIAEPIPIKVVYEDVDLIVVDKPPGIAVHPGPGHPSHTLANAVLAYLPGIHGGEQGRPGIVHRLDKDTSGLIIVARHPKAHENLANQFKNRTVDKTYITLVKGLLNPAEGFIEAPIGRDRIHRQKMTVTDEQKGRNARTGYRVIEYLKGCTLLEVSTETGRTHQIRVHFSAIGHPVVGDVTYGTPSTFVSRQFLHASKLAFKLPANGIQVKFESRLPPDLRRALDCLRS